MKKLLCYFLLIILVLIIAFTNLISNFYFLLTENGYQIPEESSIFSFEATQMNNGSGGWWIYGEDHEKFYANADDTTNTILSIEKTESKKIEEFNKLDYKTWKLKSKYQ